MASFFNPFFRSRSGDAWFSVGRTSSFPNITADDGQNIAHLRPCSTNNAKSPGCKVYHVPKEDSTRASEVFLDESGAPAEAGGLRDQVLVFQYKGKFHAINHASHHAYYLVGNLEVDLWLTCDVLGMPPFILSSFERHTFRH